MSGDVDEVDEEERVGTVQQVLSRVTPDPIRRSFAVKFAVALVVIGLLIGAIGFGATSALQQETAENVRQEYRGVASQESSIIFQWVSRSRRTALLMSQSSKWLQDPSEASLDADLRSKWAIALSTDDSLHLINASRQIVASSSQDLSRGQSLTRNGRREWLAQRNIKLLSPTQVVVTDTYTVDGQEYVGFLSMVGRGGGSNRFILLEVNTDGLRQQLSGAERAEGGFTQVVNASSGTVMVSERGGGALTQYASSSSARRPLRQVRQLPAGETGVITDMPASQEVIDQEYVVSYTKVPTTDWAVLVHAPRSSVFGFVQTVSQWGLYATGLAILLTAVVGAVLGISTSRAIDRLRTKAEQIEEGDLDVTLYTTRIDNIGRLYDGFANMRDALKEQIEEAEQARKEAEVSRAEAEEMATYLQEKADEYAEIMQQCAAGDLTQRMETEGENDAIDRIATEFNDMVGELEKTTGQLQSYVDEVEQAGAEVEASADTVRDASEQVADSIQQISEDAADQRQRLRDVSESVDDIAATLETQADDDPELQEALDRLREISSRLNEIADLAGQTQDETDNVSAAAEEQAAELTEVSERASDLQQYAEPLRDILERFETEEEHEFVFSIGPTSETAAGAGTAGEEATGGDSETETEADTDAEEAETGADEADAGTEGADAEDTDAESGADAAGGGGGGGGE